MSFLLKRSLRLPGKLWWGIERCQCFAPPAMVSIWIPRHHTIPVHESSHKSATCDTTRESKHALVIPQLMEILSHFDLRFKSFQETSQLLKQKKKQLSFPPPLNPPSPWILEPPTRLLPCWLLRSEGQLLCYPQGLSGWHRRGGKK